MSDRIKPCIKALEFRDGVTCGDGRLDGICHNHIVVAGLRQHSVDADRFELENRRLTEQLARVTAERDAAVAALVAAKSFDDHRLSCREDICFERSDLWHKQRELMVRVIAAAAAPTGQEVRR